MGSSRSPTPSTCGTDGLNFWSFPFAHALDKQGIPGSEPITDRLPDSTTDSRGSTAFSYPDFIVWSGNDVFVIDTKGAHLLSEAATRKLLWIEPPRKAAPRLFVKLVERPASGRRMPRRRRRTATRCGGSRPGLAVPSSTLMISTSLLLLC